MSVFADVQFFKVNGHFIVKEFASVSENSLVAHHIFQPPANIKLSFKDQKNIEWLQKNHLGINWSSGTTPYGKLNAVICENLKDKVVFTKGLQKTNFLKIHGVNAYNVEDFGIHFKIKEITDKIACTSHESENNVCALRNAFYLKKLINV